MKIFTIANFLFLFLTQTCFAQEITIPEKTINVHLVHVLGENALSKQRVLELFNIARGEYSWQTSLNLKLKYFRVRRKDNLQQTLSTGSRLAILRFYERQFSKRRRHKLSHVSIAILPPIKDNGIYYLAGYANGTCKIGNKFGLAVAVSNAEEANNAGLLRFVHSVVAFMHELGHLLGASHNDALPATIMHSAALGYIDSQGGSILEFHPDSIKQILFCINRKL